MRLLLLSDIHANFPALRAITKQFAPTSFDHIINCGDSLVYGPFPNKTLHWLRAHNSLSILGNTDKKVIKLLRHKSFNKPTKADKRIMYSWTADRLSKSNQMYLRSLPKTAKLSLPAYSCDTCHKKLQLGIFHGSPAAHHEFVFADTADSRFLELADKTSSQVVITGHSHTPYYKYLANVHFVNPGSVGRMFDGDPRASFATLDVREGKIKVEHFRISYPIAEIVSAIRANKLPDIYAQMFLTGTKLN